MRTTLFGEGLESNLGDKWSEGIDEKSKEFLVERNQIAKDAEEAAISDAAKAELERESFGWLADEQSVQGKRDTRELPKKGKVMHDFKSSEGGLEIPACKYEPATGPTKGVYLHIHGGGGVMAAPESTDELLQLLADECKLRVITVNYRLAPAHPQPAGANDCFDVAKQIIDGKSLYGPLRLIGGESAGALLTVLTYLRLHKDGWENVADICGILCLYGYYDLNQNNGGPLSPGEGCPLPNARTYEKNEFKKFKRFVELYLGSTPADVTTNPEVSPYYEDLSELIMQSMRPLCPALFLGCSEDTVREESRKMATKWHESSKTNNTRSNTIFRQFAGAWHGFINEAKDTEPKAPLIKEGKDYLVKVCNAFLARAEN